MNLISFIGQNLTSFEKKRKYGFPYGNGKTFIEPKNKYVKDFSDDLAAVKSKTEGDLSTKPVTK